MTTPTDRVGRSLPPGRHVVVEVPATSANLGPGFDCFGLALDWRESVRLEVIDSGFELEVTGEGADMLPRDASHLIIRSVLRGLADLGLSVPGLRLTGHNTIPQGRGLGSSSAAIVAGLVAARGLAGAPVDPAWLLSHANAVEGHPDNVAAAIYGGFVMAYVDSDGVSAVRGVLHHDLAGVLFVPDVPVGTTAARALLPESVPHRDAAANAARAALLVHAMATDLSRLHEATRDWLHQDYRRSAMPASHALLTTLRAAGHAAVVSGAGPSVLAIGSSGQVSALADRAEPGFRVLKVAVGEGAGVVVAPNPSPARSVHRSDTSPGESASLDVPKK